MLDAKDPLYISHLLFKSLSGDLDASEKEQLEAWRLQSEQNANLFQEFQQPKIWKTETVQLLENKAKVDQALLRANVPIISEQSAYKDREVVSLSARWLKYAAAIIVIIGMGVLIYFIQHSSEPKENVVQSLPSSPDYNRATLTLSDGSVIELDSSRSGIVAMDGQARVVQSEHGQLRYETAGASQTNIMMHMMTTPAGGQYNLILPDGSRVWLNASSSIIYPAVFTGNERTVTVTGEAYFEVAKNADKPFRVKVKDALINVLGTSFNVNAYNDEPALKTTLLNGSVKVSAKNTEVLLHPGEQFQLTDDKPISVKKGVNIDEVIAWKEGFFHFESADLRSILREFSRWYNVDVVYQGTITTEKFFVIVNRKSGLRQVLEALQANKIDFKIDGRKLIVKAIE